MSTTRNHRRKQKARQKKDQQKPKGNDRIIMTVIIAMIVLSLVGLGMFSFYNSPQVKNAQKIEQSEGPVPVDLVCMVFDSYKGVKQIPVEVGGVIYYGCCQGCIDKLKNNLNNVRYAVDPFSKNQVDKGKAYVVIKPNSKGAVLYFESEENYHKYNNN